MHSVVELNGLEVSALQDIAKSLQIREASSLTKKDLILKIVEAESGISVSSSASDAGPRRRGRPAAAKPAAEAVGNEKNEDKAQRGRRKRITT